VILFPNADKTFATNHNKLDLHDAGK
jgi:hypothetical protein